MFPVLRCRVEDRKRRDELEKEERRREQEELVRMSKEYEEHLAKERQEKHLETLKTKQENIRQIEEEKLMKRATEAVEEVTIFISNLDKSQNGVAVT